ncbi:methionine sulfoxide reductase A [Alkalihalobacillus alcalophilus ATCC 27647 = CGMCC 1.3604]|uniref:Peptide methionine sulfoxide reductase MsrA n=1 Tax=Alkalihalobacillus alcalophilus ATCC 27647 = CGMCC 1.3604 TaxID=1218173 RepID=A0A4S4K0V6_ALKAL|nr:peptide-methionine (S)-S-oxide reductase MsrA [Alkalihalobacillus alcalophilus]MED1564081.1 peptide-methionine (S)-S-oxide reductase MsrA [Alkalihalobacillus alcalophilus]THG90457.1 methionine sulfoxide reductase A [Alkalihalobacillus alcalophilus ATCC 27647 = CGMCC 1.3604]
MSNAIEKATFAGGCFWCMVQPFDELPGIIKVESGYMGGHSQNPTYQEVKTGETGHYEVVQITYDREIFPYERLLQLYWPQIDPTDPDGQFHDRGSQYRTAVFYHTSLQKEEAEKSKKQLEQKNIFKKPIVTQILPASEFYLAEEEHQDFYKKEPNHYKADRQKSGRDHFIESHWEKNRG